MQFALFRIGCRRICGRHSPVGIATGFGPGLKSLQKQERPDWLWGPTSLQSNGDQMVRPLGSSGQTLIKDHTVKMYGELEV
jgi:hypothetical protein